MSNEKICPIMAKGWLSNPNVKSTWSSVWALENLPKCVKEKCALYNAKHCELRTTIVET